MLDAVADLSGELNEQLAASAIVDPRTIPVRFSNLKHMARSAAHYHDAAQGDSGDTLARRLGRGTHAMVLGQPVTRFDGRRAGKTWDLFRAAHDGTEILNPKEWAESEAMSNAIKRCDLAAELLIGDRVIREHRLTWHIGGRQCAGTPDARPRDRNCVVDLKTCQTSHPDKFTKSAAWMNYHTQLAWYANGIGTVSRTPDDLFIVAIESKRPYAVTVFRLTDEARDMGDRLWRSWLEQLLVCEVSNSWPAYSQSVVPFDVESEQFGITIDGIPFDEEEA